jgi:uncharacterized LabA/DUF88 family protein
MGLWKLFGKSEPGKGKKENRLAIFIDYENIAREAALSGKILDFDKLLEECLEVGSIDFAFVFVPAHLVSYRLPEYIYNKGFYIVSCPSAYNGKGLKEKDRVDTIMTEIGRKLIERSDLTHIVIVSHDGDFVRLANDAKLHRKRVVAIAGESISFLLKKVVDIIYPLPLKIGNGNGF